MGQNAIQTFNILYSYGKLLTAANDLKVNNRMLLMFSYCTSKTRKTIDYAIFTKKYILIFVYMNTMNESTN